MPGIVRRKGKSWQIGYDLGRDPLTGRRRRAWETVRGSEKEARALLIQRLAARDAGLDVEPTRMTVGAFLERWLRDYTSLFTAPKTQRNYEGIVRLHLTPELGGIRLNGLRPDHIQTYYARMLREKGLSKLSVRKHHQVLNSALRFAVRQQLLARNPVEGVSAPKAERRNITPPAPAAVRALVDVADRTRYGALVFVAVMTGMRLGELLGLRWQDVVLDRGTLRVVQVAQWLSKEGTTFRQPKTATSRRGVALSPDTVARLREHRRRQLEEKMRLGPAYRDKDLVFATPIGTAIDPGNLRRAWLKIRAEAGLDGLRWHDLRHTCASLMLLRGTNPKVVSERLGHAGIGITVDVYSHLMPGLQEEAAAGLDELLRQTKSEAG